LLQDEEEKNKETKYAY